MTQPTSPPSRAPAAFAEALAYAAPTTHIHQGNQAVLLVGGEQAYPAMLAAIDAAERNVLLESYIIGSDATGHAFLQALGRAAQRGVGVRLLYDAVGCWTLPSSWLAELTRTGALVQAYRPVAPWRRHWGLWRRNHRKILIVDESQGFVGGLNLADEYAGTSNGMRWRDYHLELRGPALVSLIKLAVRTWNRYAEPNQRMLWHPPSLTALEPGLPVGIVSNRETRPSARIRQSFLHAVRSSQRSVTVANPYFIPDRVVTRALRQAASRGVDVCIVVPQRSDIWLVDLAARAVFPPLLRAGIRIAEWPGMIHAKAAAVDGLWASVGSYNFDRRSFQWNLEVTANVFDRRFASQLEAHLRADFAEARELGLEALAQRPLYLRLASALAYRLRAWL